MIESAISRRSLVAAAAIGLLPFAMPGHVRAGGPARVIRIASPDLSAGPRPFAGTSTISLAHIHGASEREFARDGIKVEWSFFKGAGPAVNEAFANQQIDFAYLGDLASIIGRAGGLKTRLLLAVRGSNTYLGVPLGSSIKGLKDLKGKRVALFRGTADQLSLDRSLAEVGLRERDLQIINLDWTAARAALAARQVDAAWQGPALLTLRDRGQILVPTSTKATRNRQVTTQAGLVGTEAFIDQNPQLTQRLIDVLVRQARWAADPAHRATLEQTFADQGSLPLTLVQGEFAGDDLNFRFDPRLDHFIATSYVNGVASARELGLIRRDYDARAWLAPQFVEQSLVRLGLKDFWPEYDARGSAIAR